MVERISISISSFGTEVKSILITSFGNVIEIHFDHFFQNETNALLDNYLQNGMIEYNEWHTFCDALPFVTSPLELNSLQKPQVFKFSRKCVPSLALQSSFAV